MISLLFWLGSEVVIIKIDGNNLLFKNLNANTDFVPIENLKLNREGVVKEFPDLVNKENWKQEAIVRFKKHFKEIKTEKEKVDYVVGELKNNGYILKQTQIAGSRWKHYKNGEA